jgi:hypothetical protein
MDPTLQLVLDILAALFRVLGMLLFGLAAGWGFIEFLRKGQQAWELQIAVFLGFVGLAIAMARFLSPAALGGFGVGTGVAVFLWGMQRAKAKDEDDKSKK